MGKVAMEVMFSPIIRVVVEDNENANNDAFDKAMETLRSKSKAEILEWIDENVETIFLSPEPYNAESDD